MSARPNWSCLRLKPYLRQIKLDSTNVPQPSKCNHNRPPPLVGNNEETSDPLSAVSDGITPCKYNPCFLQTERDRKVRHPSLRKDLLGSWVSRSLGMGELITPMFDGHTLTGCHQVPITLDSLSFSTNTLSVWNHLHNYTVFYGSSPI